MNDRTRKISKKKKKKTKKKKLVKLIIIIINEYTQMSIIYRTFISSFFLFRSWHTPPAPMLVWIAGYRHAKSNKKQTKKRQHKNHYTIKLRLYFLGCSSSGSGFGVGSLKDSGLSSLPGPTGSQAVLPAEKFLMACVNSRGS